MACSSLSSAKVPAGALRRAGAATAVIVKESAAMPVEQPKEVRLTRPFVYAIIDTRTNLPLFIGAQTDI